MAVQRFAILDGEKVVNLILWDNADEFEAPEGQVVLEAEDHVGIGWELAPDGEWIPPVPLPEPEIPEVVENPIVLDAKFSALKELTDLGISETNARIIVGLPPSEA